MSPKRPVSDLALKVAQATLRNARSAAQAPRLRDTVLRGAAIGAAASVPIPFAGMISGALVGASIAAYDHLKRD